MGRKRKNMKQENGRACAICVQYFNLDQTRARILPCGHSLCTRCISDNIKKNHLQCPSCRRKHKASVATDFPVNFGLERLLLAYPALCTADSDDSTDLKPIVSEPPNRALDLSDDMNEIFVSMREEIIRNLKRPNVNMKEVRTQVQQYRSLVADWKEHHQRSMEGYKAIGRQLEEMIESLQEESERVSKALKDGARETAKLKMAKEKLDAAQTVGEVIPAIIEADFCYDVVQNWNLQAEKDFPNEDLLKKSDMLNERAEKVLLTYSAVEKRLVAATKGVNFVEIAERAVAVAEANESKAAHPA